MAKEYIVRGDIQKEPSLIVKDQLLLSPGTWNGKFISGEEIRKGMINTDWTDSQRRSIVYGHRVDGDSSPDMWIGSHSIPEYKTAQEGAETEGMYADLYIYDDSLARKVAYGNVRCGVSERLKFKDSYDGVIVEGYMNLSIVDNPACKTAFLNLSDEGDTHIAEILSPNYLNLSDDPINGKSDLPIIERGSNDVEMTDKLDLMEKRLDVLEGNKLNLADGDANATPTAPVTPATPAAPTVPAEPATPAQAAAPAEPKPTTPVVEPTSEPAKPVEPATPAPAAPTVPAEPTKVAEPVAPVVITKEPIVTDNAPVVDAINKMSNTMADEIKKVANPQTVAPTNPNPSMSNEDDKITENLVKQYYSLHPELNNE